MRYKATKDGRVPFTAAEEAEWDAMDAEYEAGALDRRMADLAMIRSIKESAGITVTINDQDIKVATDVASMERVSRAVKAITKKTDRIIKFKAKNGIFDLEADEVIIIDDAITEHVQACFDRYGELVTALGADINTDITTGWPE